jgi:hypothetical protein
MVFRSKRDLKHQLAFFAHKTTMGNAGLQCNTSPAGSYFGALMALRDCVLESGCRELVWNDAPTNRYLQFPAH